MLRRLHQNTTFLVLAGTISGTVLGCALARCRSWDALRGTVDPLPEDFSERTAALRIRRVAQRKRSRRARPETLVRWIELSSVSARVSEHPSGIKGAEPQVESAASLEFSGTLNEPIRDTRDVEIVLYATDQTRAGGGPPPWIGSVDNFRPFRVPLSMDLRQRLGCVTRATRVA
jgi:hypothetical protein